MKYRKSVPNTVTTFKKSYCIAIHLLAIGILLPYLLLILKGISTPLQSEQSFRYFGVLKANILVVGDLLK